MPLTRLPVGLAAVVLALGFASAPATGEDACHFPPGLEVTPFADGAVAGIGGQGPHRIVLKWIIVRRDDGTGGLNEDRIPDFMRDLNYGFRDTPFMYVSSPDIEYLDNDALYADVPDWPTATSLLQGYAEPGVIVTIVAPSIFNNPIVTGLNFPSNPRGQVFANHRIGQPDSIAYPPHELGHIFFLYHPFETQFGLECTSGTGCAVDGDLVCDTPASPAVFSGNTTATGIFFANQPGPCPGDPPFAPLTDLYMEAGWAAGHILRDRFTDGQLTRMTSALFSLSSDLIGPARPDILVDCNGNGLDDLEEILDGRVPDLNRDLMPDSCQNIPLPGDLLVTGMTTDSFNRVRYFDGATGDFRDTMWNGMPWVHQLRMGPDGLIYQCSLTVIQRMDPAHGRTVDNFIDGVLEGASVFVDFLWDDDGNLRVLDNVAKNILRYDGTTGAYLGVFTDLSSVMSSPKYMTYGPDGHIYIVGNGSGGATMQRVDGATGSLLGSFVTPGAGGLGAGQGIVLRNGVFYVANGTANNVLLFSATTGAYLGNFVTPGSGGLSNPHSLRFGPDDNLYVASRNTNSVKRYQGANGAYLGDFVAPGSGAVPGTGGLVQPAGLLFMPAPCPGDADGDGDVDVDDLNRVILDWGSDGSAHGGDVAGARPGDAPDGVVDVNDLNAVILSWGNCP